MAAIWPPSCDLFSDDGGWNRFNHVDDEVVIEVTADAALGDDLIVDLSSTTGAVIVGELTVSPSSGPVGTAHVVTVWVFDDYAERVGRVTLDTFSDARGTEEILLVRDSAEIGMWRTTVTSYGAEGEVRSDIFALGLWEAAEDGSTSDEEAR